MMEASPQRPHHGAQDELLHSFNRLSLAAGSIPPYSSSLSPAQSSCHPSDRHMPQNDGYSTPLSQQRRVPRRTPSTSSLRDERRVSTPSLQKRLSTTSLRSSMNTSSSQRPSLSRRSSSQFLSSPGAIPKSPLAEMASPSLPPTAASIASEYFTRELSLHESTDLNSRTVVIIQDACYGHRYSRPRTSKAGLELIVERPERMHASVLGLATAYTRMGEKYGDNDFAPHPNLDTKLLPVPPFQIRKTSRSMPLNSPAVTHVHGTKWMDELRTMCDAAESRLALNGKELVRPNSSGKDGGASAPKLHEGDLYLCPESQNAFEGALGGVCDAVDSVFTSPSTRRAFVCIRPPGHHCSASYPSGFCWLNNVHVGIAYAAMTHGLTHAAILDFDLHHGDGSQSITWEQNRKASTAAKNAASHKKSSIGYFSLHDINSYPCEGGDEAKVRNASVCLDNAHGQSIWNVHLESWKTTQDFWRLYDTKYSILIEKARAFLRSHSQHLANSPNSPPPKAAIFLSAGFDASEWEGAGMQRHKVNVPTDFYARFTADVVRLSQEEGLGVDGRVISVLEGGYSDRALTSGVLSHLSGLSDTRNSASKDQDHQGSRLAAEMFNRLGLADDNRQLPLETLSEEPIAFDTIWWAPAILEELEDLVKPPPPSQARKPRGPPSFCAPTQASSAKIATPTRDRKSLPFGQRSPGIEELAPPLPEIDWATAAFELSKILIPTNRQTLSCQHSDLKAETSRTRRDARLPANSNDSNRTGDGNCMQLRERKQKVSTLPNQRIKSSRSSSISTRRTTIASISDLPDSTMSETVEKIQEVKTPMRLASRRVSLASTITSKDNATPEKIDQRKARASSTRPFGKNSRTASQAGSSSNGDPPDSLEPRKIRPATRGRIATTASRSSPRKLQSSTDKPPGKSSPEDSNQENREVNGLTANVKKLNIKLKVPTPEENALREAKIAEERKSSGIPRTSKKTRATGGKTPRTGRGPSGRQSPTKSREDTTTSESGIKSASKVKVEYNPIDSPDPTMIPLPKEADVGISCENPPIIYSPADESIMHYGTSHNNSQVYNPGENAPIPSPPLTPNSAQGLVRPGITVKPPSAPAHQSLPIFTSDSVIPFAPYQDKPANQNQQPSE